MIKQLKCILLTLTVACTINAQEFIREVHVKDSVESFADQKLLNIEIDERGNGEIELDLTGKNGERIGDLYGLSDLQLPAPYTKNQVVYLGLGNNALESIKQDDFKGFPNLREINLRYNPIQRIDPTAFLQLPHLQRVYLQGISLEPHEIEELRKKLHESGRTIATPKNVEEELESEAARQKGTCNIL